MLGRLGTTDPHPGLFHIYVKSVKLVETGGASPRLGSFWNDPWGVSWHEPMALEGRQLSASSLEASQQGNNRIRPVSLVLGLTDVCIRVRVFQWEQECVAIGAKALILCPINHAKKNGFSFIHNILEGSMWLSGLGFSSLWKKTSAK